MNKKKISLSTTQIILLSFLITILIGSLLLSLPISSANKSSVPYVDALFTATTATCVTGLVTLPTATTWSVFGQVVILLLIQIGGLGVITIMTGFMLMQGQGMTRSVSLATHFFEQAAKQDFPAAQYVLGQIYYKGLGVPTNKKEGKKWLLRAAQNGSLPARVFLENINE